MNQMTTPRRNRWTGKVTMTTAIHESGHAIARLALNEACPYPGPRLKEITARPGGDYSGLTTSDARCRSFPTLAQIREEVAPGAPDPAGLVAGAVRDCRLDIVETWVGPLAEIGPRGGLLGSAVAFLPGADQDGDLGAIRHRLRWLGLGDGAEAEAECERLWWAALALVQAERAGILAVAKVLHREGTMDGEAFEAAWREVRPTVAQRMARWNAPGWSGNRAEAERHGISYRDGVLHLPD